MHDHDHDHDTDSGSARLLHCPHCQEDCLFERPPCSDGHGVDCPEWACVSCGCAVMAEFVVAAITVGAPAVVPFATSARPAA